MEKTTYQDLDSDTGLLVKEYSMADIHKVADFCKEMHNSGYHGTKDDKVIASVDPAIIHAWIEKHGITFNQFMIDQSIVKRFLEDSDNSHFRIWKGRI